MLAPGDRVRHKRTGQTGKVVAVGAPFGGFRGLSVQWDNPVQRLLGPDPSLRPQDVEKIEESAMQKIEDLIQKLGERTDMLPQPQPRWLVPKTLTLSLELDNDAFSDFNEAEAARIICKAAETMKTYGIQSKWSSALRDVNGNVVGEIQVR